MDLHGRVVSPKQRAGVKNRRVSEPQPAEGGCRRNPPDAAWARAWSGRLFAAESGAMDPKATLPDIEPLLPRDGLTRLPQSDWMLGVLLFAAGVAVILLIVMLLRRGDQ